MDLFSGSAQLGLAFHDGLLEGFGVPSRTVAYCEFADYAQALLLSRMRRGEIHSAPICSDIRELQGADLGPVDAIAGGWPCQGNSLAGRRKGMADERSGLVVEVIRLVRELGPTLVFLENVPGVLTAPGDGVGYVADALAGLGYELRWTDLSAADVGQAHERRRFWLMAYRKQGQRRGRADAAEHVQPNGQAGGWEQSAGELERGGEELGHAENLRHQRAGGARERGSGSTDPRPSLGDHHSQRGREERGKSPRQSGHNRQPGETLGHGLSTGLEIRPSFPSDYGQEQQASKRGGLPMVPPGRQDAEGWSRVIALGLDAQPTLRRVAPRLAFRADRIRVVGNGVDYPAAKAAVKALLGA